MDVAPGESEDLVADTQRAGQGGPPPRGKAPPPPWSCPALNWGGNWRGLEGSTPVLEFSIAAAQTRLLSSFHFCTAPESQASMPCMHMPEGSATSDTTCSAQRSATRPPRGQQLHRLFDGPLNGEEEGLEAPHLKVPF